MSISGYLQLVSFAGTNYCETISNVVNYGFNSAGICYPISSFPIVALPTAPQSVKVSSINPLGSAVSVQGYSDLSCKTAQVNNSFVFLNTSQGICPQGGVLQTPVPKYFIYVGSSVPASPLSTYLNVK